MNLGKQTRRFLRSADRQRASRACSPRKLSQPGFQMICEPLEERRLLDATTVELLKDINPGGSSNPSNFVQVGGLTFFIADDGPHGVELWKTDGTEAGTMLVKDIRPGSGDSSPAYLTNLNGTLFFSADDGTQGKELWKSDGTEAGTVLVMDIAPGSNSSLPGIGNSFVECNDMLFFSAADSFPNIELWVSDGTLGGTYQVKEILPGPGGGAPRELTEVNGKVYFGADDGMHGDELWTSDGTPEGTFLLNDIYPGHFPPQSIFPASSFPSQLTNVNGSLYFRATNATYGTEPYRGSGLLSDVAPGPGSSSPSDFAGANGAVFFAAFGTGGRELWKNSGGSTVLVKDILPGTDSSSPGYLTDVNGTIFFRANGGTNDWELWKSDGSEAGTVLVKDIQPGAAGNPVYLTNVNGALFFSANNGANGYELWRSNGTEAGTVMAKDIQPGAGGSSPKYLANINGTLFFSADDGTHGRELFAMVEFDNTAPQVAEPLLDVTVGVDSAPSIIDLTATFSDIDIAVYNDLLTLSVSDNTNPSLLTASILGTTLTLDFAPGQAGSATITVRATDLGDEWVEDSFLVTVLPANHTPVLDPIGNHSLGEGPWSLVVSATDDDAGDTLTFSLGPGAPAGLSIAPGPGAREATLSWTPDDDALVSPNPASVTVIVTDNGAGPLDDSETIQITVENTPPSAGIAGPQVTNAGVSQSFTLSATDLGAIDQAAGFTFDIDWNGNGTFGETEDEQVTGPSGTTVNHSFAAVGSHNVGVRATDKDGGQSTTFVLPVHVWQVQQVGDDVEWEGSDADDIVEFEQTAPGVVEVRTLQVGGIATSFVQSFTGVTGRVIAKGRDGDDLLDASELMTIAATLEGGRHNDTITGGAASDILRGEFVGATGTVGDGGEGNDSITGGAGNDLIEGDGLEGGSDTLRGGDGFDTIYGDGGDGLEGRADSLFGDDGDDWLFGNHGSDYIETGSGVFNVASGGDGAESNDTLVGDANSSDLLVGQNGSDSLSGGGGLDVLLGGSGADTLLAGGDEDLLVADSTSWDDDVLASAFALFDEWAGSVLLVGRTYEERVFNLTVGSEGLNGDVHLVPGATVFDDGAADVLMGGASRDWFLYNLMEDALGDHEDGEVESDTFGT